MKRILSIAAFLCALLIGYPVAADNMAADKVIAKAEQMKGTDQKVNYLVEQAQEALKNEQYAKAEKIMDRLEDIDKNHEKVKRLEMQAAQNRDYQAQIKQVRNETSKKIDQVERDLQREIANIQHEALESVEDARINYSQKVKAIRKETRNDLQESKPNDDIQVIQRKAEEDIAKLQREFQKEINEIRRETRAKIASTRKDNLESRREAMKEYKEDGREAKVNLRGNKKEVSEDLREDMNEARADANDKIREIREDAQERVSELQRKKQYDLTRISAEGIYGRVNQTQVSNNQLWPVTAYLGNTIINTKGENLGEIEDVVINPSNGQIQYAVISHGGFMGIGDKVFAVEWKQLKPSSEDDEWVLNLDEEVFEYNEGLEGVEWLEKSSKITFKM